MHIYIYVNDRGVGIGEQARRFPSEAWAPMPGMGRDGTCPHISGGSLKGQRLLEVSLGEKAKHTWVNSTHFEKKMRWRPWEVGGGGGEVVKGSDKQLAKSTCPLQ